MENSGEHLLPQGIRAVFALSLVEDAEGRLLFLKRSTKAKLGPGLWGLPGGRLESGETPRQCSYREMEEELGNAFRVELIRSMGPVKDTLYGGIYQVHLFHYRWKGGGIRLSSEHSDWAWVRRENYRSLDVVDGIDEDIHYLGIWPDAYLNPDKLPKAGR